MKIKQIEKKAKEMANKYQRLASIADTTAKSTRQQWRWPSGCSVKLQSGQPHYSRKEAKNEPAAPALIFLRTFAKNIDYEQGTQRK